jgi:hypothetical protein
MYPYQRGGDPMTRLCLFVLVICISILSACAGPAVQFGPLNRVSCDESSPLDITATECGTQILLFFPFFNNGRYERAVKKIEKSAKGRYIANVRVRERWLYLVFGTIHCTDVVALTYPTLNAANKQATTE